MTAWVFTVSALVAGLIATWLSLKSGDWPSALMHGLITLVYPVDAIAVLSSGSVFLAFSQGPRPVDMASLAEPAVLVFLFISTLLAVEIVRYVRSRGRVEPYVLDVPSGRTSILAYWRIILITALCGALLFPRIASAGLELGLQSRNALLNGNPLLLLIFNILPVACLFCLIAAMLERGARRVLAAALGMVSIIGVFFLGSRSALLFSCIFPFVLFLVLRHINGKPRSKIRVLFLIVTLGIVLQYSLTSYLDTFREVKNSFGFLDGPDVSQFDALVGLCNSSYPGSSSYLSATLFFLPREYYPDKPLTGNAISSQLLTPARYELTGAETTAGALGEGWINFGWLGFLSAALLCLAVNSLSRYLLRSRSFTMSIAGLVICFRGLNIVRSDLVNVVVPIVTAFAVAVIIHRSKRVEASRRRG